MAASDINRQVKTPATGADAGNQAIVDSNLKVTDRLAIPSSPTNTFNGGKVENGVIKLSLNADGDLILNSYADGKWTEYLAVLDGLKAVGEITLLGNDVTIVAPVKWRINSINYEKLTDTIITVNSATDGFKRIDYIYADTNGDILLIEGTEVADGNPYIPPTLPVNTIMVAPVYISGDTVLQPIPDLSGYLTKVQGDVLYIHANPLSPQDASINLHGSINADGNITVGGGSEMIFIYGNTFGFTKVGVHESYIQASTVTQNRIWEMPNGSGTLALAAPSGNGYIYASPALPQQENIYLKGQIRIDTPDDSQAIRLDNAGNIYALGDIQTINNISAGLFEGSIKNGPSGGIDVFSDGNVVIRSNDLGTDGRIILRGGNVGLENNINEYTGGTFKILIHNQSDGNGNIEYSDGSNLPKLSGESIFILTDPKDYVQKDYVDGFLPLTGGTITGNLIATPLAGIGDRPLAVDSTGKLIIGSGGGGGDLQSVTDSGNETTNGASFGGTVLIGTTTDDGIHKLQVEGSGRFKQEIKVDEALTDNMLFIVTSDAAGIILNVTDYNGFTPKPLFLQQDGTAGGNVVIGGNTDDGTNKLQVEGNGNFIGYIETTDGFYMNNPLYGGVFGVTNTGTAYHVSSGLQFVKLASDGISSDATINISPNPAQVSPSSMGLYLPNEGGELALIKQATDYEVTDSSKGLILKDVTLGTRHRITLDNGVLVISAAL